MIVPSIDWSNDGRAGYVHTFGGDRRFLEGRGRAPRIRLEFQPRLLPPRGQRGCFRAKARRICGARRDGRHQTPRASNSPSNCIAWRHTNDCIFASRHRVAIGKLVSSRDHPRQEHGRVHPFLSLSDISTWNETSCPRSSNKGEVCLAFSCCTAFEVLIERLKGAADLF